MKNKHLALCAFLMLLSSIVEAVPPGFSEHPVYQGQQPTAQWLDAQGCLVLLYPNVPPPIPLPLSAVEAAPPVYSEAPTLPGQQPTAYGRNAEGQLVPLYVVATPPPPLVQHLQSPQQAHPQHVQHLQSGQASSVAAAGIGNEFNVNLYPQLIEEIAGAVFEFIRRIRVHSAPLQAGHQYGASSSSFASQHPHNNPAVLMHRPRMPGNRKKPKTKEFLKPQGGESKNSVHETEESEVERDPLKRKRPSDESKDN